MSLQKKSTEWAQRHGCGLYSLVNRTALRFDMLKWFEGLYLKVLPQFISRHSITLFQNGYFNFNLVHCVIFLCWESWSGWVLVSAVTLATMSKASSALLLTTPS